jgi:sugar transferase (PEP-CTERM/EpsH1 system associated)
MHDILFLAHRIPYPPDKGDKIRSWNILRYLAERARVHLGAFVDDPDDFRYADALASVCASQRLVALTKQGRAGRIANAFRRGMPLSVALYENPEMRRWVSQAMRSHPIDRMFVFSSQMALYALEHKAERRRLVMDFVDIDSDKFRQYSADSSWPRSWLYAREARTLGDFEKQVARRADVSLFVSDAETAMFKKLAGSYGHRVETLHNGVDLDYFSPTAPVGTVAWAGSPRLVFTGAMDYRPNIDAVGWFVAEVFPVLRSRFPAASFAIVGAKPDEAVKRLGDIDGVLVTGRVPDVRPYLKSADVAVAPLRIARGVQNKVLEAMAMARPVVATTAAFSGIDASPGEDLLVVDDAPAFAAAIAEVAGSRARAAALGDAARRCVETRYSWAGQLSRLDADLLLDNYREAAE